MNCNTGEIFRHITEDQIAEATEAREKLIVITEEQFETLKPMSFSGRKGWMRNRQCNCGSGKKFKNCCW